MLQHLEAEELHMVVTKGREITNRKKLNYWKNVLYTNTIINETEFLKLFTCKCL